MREEIEITINKLLYIINALRSEYTLYKLLDSIEQYIDKFAIDDLKNINVGLKDIEQILMNSFCNYLGFDDYSESKDIQLTKLYSKLETIVNKYKHEYIIKYNTKQVITNIKTFLKISVTALDPSIIRKISTIYSSEIYDRYTKSKEIFKKLIFLEHTLWYCVETNKYNVLTIPHVIENINDLYDMTSPLTLLNTIKK